jgi:hypothetical protein
MPNTLASGNVQAFLARMFAQSDVSDPIVLSNIQREADSRFQGQRYHPSLALLFDHAIIPVPPEVGQLLYVLTRSKRPATHCRNRYVVWNFRDPFRLGAQG